MTICLTCGLRRQASSSAQVPADVGLERRDGIAVRDAHDCLRRQVDDRVGLVLAEHALQQRLVAHVAAHDVGRLDQPRAHELALGNPVADQARHVGAQRRRAAARAIRRPDRSLRSRRSADPARTSWTRRSFPGLPFGRCPPPRGLCRKLNVPDRVHALPEPIVTIRHSWPSPASLSRTPSRASSRRPSM